VWAPITDELFDHDRCREWQERGEQEDEEVEPVQVRVGGVQRSGDP
jgi:hypothetical protein